VGYRLSALTEPPDGGDYRAPGSQASQDEGPEAGAVACLRVEVAFKLVIFQSLREQVTLVSDSYSRRRWRWRGRWIVWHIRGISSFSRAAVVFRS